MALNENEEFELLSLERERAGVGSKPETRESRIASIPGGSSGEPVPAAAPNMMDKLKGAGETALTMLTGATGGALGTIGGTLGAAAGALATGKSSVPGDIIGEQARRFTYEPKTETGREYVGKVGEALAPLAGIAPGGPNMLAGPAIQQARGMGSRLVPGLDAAINARPQAAEIPGYGAAMVPQAVVRNERAQSLPVPIQLTKGQAERTFEQQRFERETAKAGSVGEPLRARFAQQNEDILRNFDAWVDDTGAQAPTLRATGQIVTQAIKDKAEKAKTGINAAYDKARASGEMEAPVNVEPIFAYLEKNRPQGINAGVIGATRGTLNQLAGQQKKDVFGQPIPRTLSINDLEEIRKHVGVARGDSKTNAHFGREILNLIDEATDGAGGQDYQYARSLHSKYAREFENIGVVDKLMSTKPGTTDRAVAFENVFDHSILNGSLDDVRMIRKTLQTGGAQGQQAWRELQGQTLNYLRDTATSNAVRDIRGNQIVSFAKIDRAIKDLDSSGKLDFIFGPQGAQKLRDIRDIAADVYTSPPGAVNTSNTGSVILQALGNMPGSFLTGNLPAVAAAGAKIYGVGKDYMGQRKLRTQVQEALNPFPQSNGILGGP